MATLLSECRTDRPCERSRSPRTRRFSHQLTRNCRTWAIRSTFLSRDRATIPISPQRRMLLIFNDNTRAWADEDGVFGQAHGLLRVQCQDVWPRILLRRARVGWRCAVSGAHRGLVVAVALPGEPRLVVCARTGAALDDESGDRYFLEPSHAVPCRCCRARRACPSTDTTCTMPNANHGLRFGDWPGWPSTIPTSTRWAHWGSLRRRITDRWMVSSYHVLARNPSAVANPPFASGEPILQGSIHDGVVARTDIARADAALDCAAALIDPGLPSLQRSRRR